MKMLARVGAFQAVGIMGAVVQLGALAVFERWLGGRYLWAAVAALEVTLLHNFCWHVRLTWRERGGSRVGQLIRFQTANGAVSLAGNLAIMRLLVHGCGVPVLAANAVAIVCCSAVNFWLGNQWVFRDSRETLSSERPGSAALQPARRATAAKSRVSPT